QKAVSCRFRHPRAVHREHVRMHPILSRLHVMAGFRLRDLVGMVRSRQVHSASMNIELRTEIFTAHGRTFDMPTRETYAPRSWPAHNMLRFCFDPQRKIQTAPFFILSA